MVKEIDSCSINVQKGIRYLEKQIKFKKIKYDPYNSDVFLILKKIESSYFSKFLEKAKTDDFWHNFNEPVDFLYIEFIEDLWYLMCLGLKDNKFFDRAYSSMKKSQTVEGFIHSNSLSHTGPLSLLVALEPGSITTQNAAKYYVENWEEDKSEYDFQIKTLAWGALALAELNYYKYKDTIDEITDYLSLTQKKEGYFGEKLSKRNNISYKIMSTSQVVRCLGKLNNEKYEKIVEKAVDWLKKAQLKDGSWPNNTPKVILALFSIGGGPKTSVDRKEWYDTLEIQKMSYMKPYFVHTSPIFREHTPVKEINERIILMIRSAKKEIKICSLFINILYEELIDICNEKPKIKIRIITRYAGGAKGLRDKIAKNVLKLLNISTKGNLRINDLLHSRMIIVDSKEMLVSSADLTREQLYDEFNSGIFTSDIESIIKANDFFENIWENSEKIKD